MKKQLITKVLQRIDFPEWNAFVDNSPQGDVFCYSWWLKAITKDNFTILAVFEDDKIVAGIPLAYYLGKINEPPLTRTLGPIFKPLPNLSEHKQITIRRRWLNLLLDKIPIGEFEQFCTSHNFTDWLPFRWRGLKQTTRYTYLIHYTYKDEKDLWAGLSRGRKETINRALKNSIHTKVTNKLIDFYKLIELTYQRQDLKFRFSYDDFKLLDDEIVKHNQRVILTAFDKNMNSHAAIYVVFNSHKAFALLSASDPQYRSHGGHTLVMWEAIKYFSSRVEYFNFGGSDIERIEQHLRGFGGDLTQYFHIYKEHPQIKEVEKLIEKEVIKEVPVITPAPPNNWHYHFDHFLHHTYCLFDLARKKILRNEKENIRISIITACYNHGKYIHEMLNSALKQTYQHFEVIIVNDGSTDDTANILKRIKHKKVRILHTPNHGPAHARNLAIANSKGDLILNLDADNKIARDFLEQCVQIMDNHPEVGIVYSQIEYFGATNGIYQIPEYSFENMLRNNCIDGNACFRKSDWEKTEGYNINMHYGYEDFDFWLSILELGREVYKIEQTMVFYRTYNDPLNSRSGRRKQNSYQLETVVVQAFRNHRELYKQYPQIYKEFCTLEKQLEQKNYPDSVNSYCPTFSIITPTNKRPGLLKRNIESIQKQSFQDWEHIIVDDANDHETKELIESYSDPRIRYFFHKVPKGAASAYNTGIKNAYGQYVNFLDDDDEFLDGILQKTKEIFDTATNKPGFVWTGITRVKDTEHGEKELRTEVWPSNFTDPVQGLMVSTAIGNGFGLSVRKSSFKHTGLYDESFKVSEDTDFMIKLSKYFNFRTVPEVLVKIHHHGQGQLTHEKYCRIKWESYRRILARHRRFLSQNWDVYYMHHMVYIGLCSQLKKNIAGFKELYWLIKLFPKRKIAWLDLLSFLLEGKDYNSGKIKNWQENYSNFKEQKKIKSAKRHTIKVMDDYRKNYDKMTFDTLTKTANKWLHIYPEQASYTLPHVIYWIEKIAAKPARVLEIGGWRGDLAKEILSRYDFLEHWHNYDLISDDSTQKCIDTRYKLIPLSDYIWNLDLPKEYNSLISTHMIEHIRWRELKLLIEWIPDQIETVLFEAPIAKDSEKYIWKGHPSTHILEKGWKQIIEKMGLHGFESAFAKDDTVIFFKKK